MEGHDGRDRGESPVPALLLPHVLFLLYLTLLCAYGNTFRYRYGLVHSVLQSVYRLQVHLTSPSSSSVRVLPSIFFTLPYSCHVSSRVISLPYIARGRSSSAGLAPTYTDWCRGLQPRRGDSRVREDPCHLSDFTRPMTPKRWLTLSLCPESTNFQGIMT